MVRFNQINGWLSTNFVELNIGNSGGNRGELVFNESKQIGNIGKNEYLFIIYASQVIWP